MLKLENAVLDRIAQEVGVKSSQVSGTIELLDDGNTVPFITRYRKERTGNLDEVQIRDIQQRVKSHRQLRERAAVILKSIESQDKLTPHLKQQIEAAQSLAELEDLYLPYRPKKRTRAQIARERGLEAFAEQLWNADPAVDSPRAAAAQYVNPEQELATVDNVLQGASDILAERIAEDGSVRESARRVALKTGRLKITAAGKEADDSFRDYFDYSEAVSKIPPHRVLAINRGETESALRVKFVWDGDAAQAKSVRLLKLHEHRFALFMMDVSADALSRLVLPSLERELRRDLTQRAEQHAIEVFARNLRNLLLQPPVRGQRVLAIDPGFRTGCKIAVLDETGNCVATDVVYITGSQSKKSAARDKLAELVSAHGCQLIAIGNGTACRETEEIAAELIAESHADLRYVIVNEAGASIYSASDAGREEFPDYDATTRGTISIGRRLQDPLSELVKIEPQHIGVGMYQHDVSPKSLKESLDEVIESCVNYVGVDLNTSGTALLSHVSGLNRRTAANIVGWRNEHGSFRTRRQLLEVAGLGQATYTQAAGFLKITGGDEPLDATWIHPESYPTTRRLLGRFELPSATPTHDETVREALQQRVAELDRPSLAQEFEIGLPTLTDILDALVRPGRDPRADLPAPIFKSDILKLEDLQPGMTLQGTVLNVVDFGAFVDIGLKDSGLVHISKLADQYVKNPHDVVAVGDVVTVRVEDIDQVRRRVSLTMRSA